MTSVFNKFSEIIIKKKSNVCIGLDPISSRMPLDDLFEFNRYIIDSTFDLVAAYKPQLAYFESFGPEGLITLKRLIEYIKDKSDEVIIIGDGKRGDISSTSEAYAKSLYDIYGFDIVTVNPYMGYDSIEPFLAYKNKGIYILCKTSNKGSEDFQDVQIQNGKKLYEYVAEKCSTWSSSDNLGFVIGATYTKELMNLREVLPKYNFLIPGIGEQGGTISDVISSVMIKGSKNNFVINSSRSILYASDNKDNFYNHARKKCIELRDNINKILKKSSV
ncbi:MAG: orotidine-5'-phosphate decarboxylase [Dehalococcoidia bacterium]